MTAMPPRDPAAVSTPSPPVAPSARRSHAWLWGVLGVGTLFGLEQLMRGAHYPSHVLWSAWICWTVAALSFSLAGWARRVARS